MNDTGIVMLATSGESTTILYNELKKTYHIDAVILEEEVSKRFLLKRRIRKLGAWRVFGQLLFHLFIPTLLKYSSSKRLREIYAHYEFDTTPIPPDKVIHVNSVNDEECFGKLQ